MKFEKTMRLAALATLATGLALAQAGSSPEASGGTTPPAGNQSMKGRRFDRIAQQLGLTADQKTQAKTIYDNARTQAQPFIPQIKAAHQAFRTAVENGAGDADLQKAADDQAMLMAKVQVIRAKAVRDFEKILTPDQLTKAKELHAFMMGRFGRHGFGGGL